MKQTTNYALNKPDGNDLVDISVLNMNMDILDTQIKALDNGKAALSHNHSAANITSGTLPVSRGGTGQTTTAGIRNSLGLGNTIGAVPIANGGTGATSAAAALAALGAAASSHTHSSVVYIDSRSANQTPTQLPDGLSVHLKNNSTDGVSHGGGYHAVLDIKQWSDTSGGMFHQLAFCDDGTILHRRSTSDSAWGAWVAVSKDGHQHNAGNITSGVFPVARGGTGVTGVGGTDYASVRFRGFGLRNSDSNPAVNGTVNWTYG